MRIFRTWDWPVFGLLLVLHLTAAGLFARYWFSRGDLADHQVIFPLLTIYLLVSVLLFETRWVTLPLMRRPGDAPAPAPGRARVGVATTFVSGSEPLEMLEATVAALVAMDYEHDTWVLDENDEPDVRELCKRLGARHFSRLPYDKYQTGSGTFERRTKHGNYNAWLDAVGFERYDIIVGFDPDHAPRREFLLRTLGYFDDPGVGYVQAPQTYYNQRASFVARGAAEETYTYYSTVQMTSYALGYPIVTGCHNVHRAAALSQVGGFAAHEADDLLITVLYRASGWRGVYLPEPLAAGLTPVDWNGYLIQQRRWARSVLDIKFRVYPRIARQLPPVERVVGWLHGLYYFQGLATALALAALVLMLVTGEAPSVISQDALPYLGLLMASVQACELYRQRFYLEPRREWGLHLRSGLLKFAKWPVVLLALLDAARPRRGYALTPKTRQPLRLRLLVGPHLTTGLVLIAALAIAARRDAPVEPALVSVAISATTASFLVAATAAVRWPDPFDARLLDDARERGYGAAALSSGPSSSRL